jgi:hypothetical protein
MRLSPALDKGRGVLIDSEKLASQHETITWSEDESFKKRSEWNFDVRAHSRD